MKSKMCSEVFCENKGQKDKDEQPNKKMGLHQSNKRCGQKKSNGHLDWLPIKKKTIINW